MDAGLRFFEDVRAGETARSAPVVVTREAILGFADVYDPQPFHLDEAAARASLLHGLAASGWHTAAIGMRLFFDAWVRHVASMGAPGIDALRWVKPVRPGDQLSALVTVEATRPSGSRADRGFARMLLELRDAGDATVMTQRFSIMLQRRGTRQTLRRPLPAPPPSAAPPRLSDAEPALAAFYEDFDVGSEVALGHQLFSPESIVAFAAPYDPQPFHLDAALAAQSHFGGLVASGWQTAACWMKHYVAARGRAAAACAAAGRPAAAGGPSPGFNDLRWIHPVRAGDTVHYGLTLIGKRPVSRPGWGLATVEGTGRTREGTLVFSFSGHILWPMARA